MYGQMAQDAIKRAGIDPQSIEAMQDIMLGRKQLPKLPEDSPKQGEDA